MKKLLLILFLAGCMSADAGQATRRPAHGDKPLFTLHSAATSNGDGDYIELPEGGSAVTAIVSGTGEFQLIPEVSLDQTSWVVIAGQNIDGTTVAMTQVVRAGGCVFNTSGWNYFRMRLANTTSANVTVVGNLSTDSGAPATVSVTVPEMIQTAFGENLTAALLPAVQIDGIYGIRTTDVETFTALGGSVGDDGMQLQVNSGTSSGGYGVIRSRRRLKYRVGQGARARFTAIFDSADATANSLQIAGMFSAEPALAFGYNGADFGLGRRHTGRLEVRKLTVSAAASGAETATITLDGTDFTVSVTAGSVQHNAYELAADTGWDDNANPTKQWVALQNDDDVFFVNQGGAGARSGTYAVSSDGTFAGSIAVYQAGVANQWDWIKQADWNRNTTPWLDPAKGNVYEIRYQYLGYGALTFGVEDPETGRFVDVHQIEYTNKNTEPSLSNPSMQIGWVAASLGSTVDLEVKGASAAGFVEGLHVDPRNSRGTSNSNTVIGTTFTNILSVRASQIFANKLNHNEVLPIVATFAVNDASKPSEVAIFLNPTFSGETNWQYLDESNSTVESETTKNTVSGGTELFAAGLPKDGAIEFVFVHEGTHTIRLSPKDVLTLAVKAVSGTTDDAAVGLTWDED